MGIIAKIEQVNTGVIANDMEAEEPSAQIPLELRSTLGLYWNNDTITKNGEQYIISAIIWYGSTVQYRNVSLKSTPQYSFTLWDGRILRSEIQSYSNRIG